MRGVRGVADQVERCAGLPWIRRVAALRQKGGRCGVDELVGQVGLRRIRSVGEEGRGIVLNIHGMRNVCAIARWGSLLCKHEGVLLAGSIEYRRIGEGLLHELLLL